ncbi:flagellar assembly protein FliH, partial [bacterium]|nr:flagellar assembly protein FliH [bacterium]
QAIKERELLIRSIEPEMARLSVRIAEKIMRYQIDIDQGAVVNMISSALETLKQREEIVVKVNQEDYYYAKEKKSVFASMVEGLKKLDVVVDSGVDRGGCIIETDLGNIDARISTQIHTLELVFDKVAEERKQEYEEESSENSVG